MSSGRFNEVPWCQGTAALNTNGHHLHAGFEQFLYHEVIAFTAVQDKLVKRHMEELQDTVLSVEC